MRTLAWLLALFQTVTTHDVATSTATIVPTGSHNHYETMRMDRYFGRNRLNSRHRRYAIEGSFWGVKTISYRISRPSTSLPLADLKEVFRRAFSVWEEHTELSFVYKPEGDVHIDIIFITGSHGDGEPFDGRGKILAHAYFPRYGGDLHFDDDELWSSDKYGPGLDLYAVAVHEVGHALGLKHSHETNAIMAPFYQTYTGHSLHLHQDDLAAVDRLYGPTGAANKEKTKSPNFKQNGKEPGKHYTERFYHETTVRPMKKLPGREFCQSPRIDAITRIANGSIYAFRGLEYWELSTSGPLFGYPRKISEGFGIKGTIDAALTDSQGNTYVFQDSLYYLFSPSLHLLPSYPRSIRKGLSDTPDRIDAAMTWAHDEKPYMFKKDKYWKYSRWGMPRTWPRSIESLFRGKAPERIDAGFMLDANSSYIFAGDKYWKLGGFRYMKVLDEYPKSTADFWFNCDGEEHPIK